MDALAPMTGARTVGRGVDRRRLVRQVLREVGWAVLAVGVVALLFAAYLIWGTRLAEEASQSALRRGGTQAWRLQSTAKPGLWSAGQSLPKLLILKADVESILLILRCRKSTKNIVRV